MEVGDEIAGYRIERLLGSGGMGSVYLARHPHVPRQVALKTLNESVDVDSGFHARFLREAELASRLSHPNVVAIHDRGEHDGCLWIAMQYVPGSDAARLIEDQPRGLEPRRAVEIVTAAAAGLDAAHAAGLLHRDVKPANILVTSTGWVLVADFGIARDTAATTALTATGEVVATLAYAAPEQLSGTAVDHRADVYALGGTLYNLLTGVNPFPRATPAEVVYAHLVDLPPKPSEIRPELPAGLDGVIARALAKAPRDRYPNCVALAADAAAALSGAPIDAGGGRRSGYFGRWPRVRVFVTAVLLVLALAAAGGVFAAVASQSGVRVSAIPRSVTDNGESGPWGVYDHIFAAFPDLLPRAPFRSGYRGLWCRVINSKSDRPFKSLDVRFQVQQVYCWADSDPLEDLVLTCREDRVLVSTDLSRWQFPPHEERWSRETDSGRLLWGTALLDGKEVGGLEVIFDNPDRNFCVMQAYSYSVTGAELRDSWWPDAPI
ncbi:serine/threonine-protein kinase [Nocardia sp. NPDC059177]|uniref:serine/threonine-protein kinase n=1 Tax=Nocardia sp. NPDC059177 TaxID=3346759 RepID=UPI0036CBC4D4